MLREGETRGEAAPSVVVRFTVSEKDAFGHGIAIESAQGVFRLAAAFVLRLASNAFLFSGAIFCLLALCSVFLSSSVLLCRAVLLRTLISFFCSAVNALLCQAALLRALISCALLGRSALLRALISSFCSVVKLFRRALSRSRLARFLSSEMFAAGCL
jgi:hypothetical protein